MENPIVSVHCIVCVLICFVSMIFPFSNIDIPINCFPEIIKPPPLLLASDVDVYLKRGITMINIVSRETSYI